MARKKKDSLSAFTDAMSEFGFDNPYQTEEVTNIDEQTSVTDIDDSEDDDTTGNSTNTEEGDTGNAREDNSDIPDNILNNNVNSSNEPDVVDDELNDTATQIDESETAGVGVFFDAFAEQLGWDVEDDQKPDSIEALVDYIKDVVEQNSVPQYADQRIQQLDEYVKNGGNFEDFYSRQQQRMSYENMDMEDESNQRAAVREFLRYQGYTDDQINRKIERYEDGDMLEEEANDALARLKYIEEQNIAQQQQQQELARQAQEKKQYEFMQNLTDSINGLDNIRGIQIPKEDRRALFDYITRTDENGMTRYQKDFNNNLVNNLIESAYFTMKGDTLLGEAKRSGRTSAADRLRTMLKHQSKNHSTYGAVNDKQRSVVDLASHFYN